MQVVLSQPQPQKEDCEFMFQVKAVLFSEAKGVCQHDMQRCHTFAALRVFILSFRLVHTRNYNHTDTNYASDTDIHFDKDIHWLLL